jgi:hypothetical protein
MVSIIELEFRGYTKLGDCIDLCQLDCSVQTVTADAFDQHRMVIMLVLMQFVKTKLKL